MWIGIVLFLGACRSERVNKEAPVIILDNDGDGFASEEDCDDNNAAVNSGAIEICDGIDNNCDGEIDEGVTTTYYLDSDGDGFGDNESTTDACSTPDGYVITTNDCNDQNADIYPGSDTQCDEINTTICSSGGIVEGNTVRGVFCFAPMDIATAPEASSASITWQPGPMTNITKSSN